MEENSKRHEPVMLKEAIDALHIKSQARYIDGTVGAGGHSISIIKGGGVLLGIDADESMLEVARRNIEDACPVSNQAVGNSYFLTSGNYRDIDTIAKAYGFSEVDGILLDLGISNLHLESETRGFSFRHQDSLLDMRLSKVTQQVTAADLLNSLRVDQLHALFVEVGELDWKEADILSKKIVTKRTVAPFKTVGDLVKVVWESGIKNKRIDPSTKVFMALRIAVNSELATLQESLPKAFSLLRPGGRLVIISFHSGEDAIVKHFMKDKQNASEGKLVYKEAIIPSQEEIEKNSKARSAKLRVIEKL